MQVEAFAAVRLGWMDPNWAEYPGEHARLVEQVEHRRREIETWEDDVLSHEGHPSLRCYESAVTRRFGFQCQCTPVIFDRVVGLSHLRFSPRVRELIRVTPRTEPPQWLQQLQRTLVVVDAFPRRALIRARAMLHRLLTREQRWSLRATNSFLVIGQDGRTYEVREDLPVQLIEDGQPKVSYCIHPITRLPPHDVMVAQKLLLETNIEHFLATANARDLRPFTQRLEEALQSTVEAA
jgi:hypothetical protein